MNRFPSDIIQFLIKIIIVSIVGCSLTQCFQLENSTSIETIDTFHPAKSEYNIYNLSDVVPKSKQEINETIIGVGKVLKKLQKDLESLYSVKEDAGKKHSSILNFMHHFVDNLMSKNSTADNILNRTERVADLKKNIGKKSGDFKSEKRKNEIFSHSFGNKRDGNIMKIFRHARVPQSEPVTKERIIEDDEKIVEEEETREENVSEKADAMDPETIEVLPEDDESTHMIDWNNSDLQNLNETEDSREVKTNESKNNTNQIPDEDTIENDSLKQNIFTTHKEGIEVALIGLNFLKYNTTPTNQKYLKGEIGKTESEWLPDIFRRIFLDFKITSRDVHSLCNSEWAFYQEHLKNLSIWAVKMYESSDTIPRGFIVGNGYQLGNFDECVAVKETTRGITGKYCLIETHLNFRRTQPTLPEQSDSVWEIFQKTRDIDLRFPKDKLYLSMCVPSACQAKDLEHSLQLALDQQTSRLNESIRFQVHEKYCYAEDQQPPHSQGFVITCGVFTILSLLVIAVSTYHLITHALDINISAPNFPMKLLLSFSAVTNLQKLFSKSSEELKFFHGMKFLSMCLIIMGHRLFHYFQSAILDAENILQKFVELDYILVHFNIVDTFFTIGGFLTFYTLYDKVKQHGLKLFPGAILYRWLRLVPVYASVISFVVIILPAIGNGPVYQLKIARDVSRCETNWWTNLLFINNYVNTAESCLVQSWYLACDFHLFLLGLLILYVISRNESAGMKLLYSCFVISIIIPFVVTWQGGHYGIMRLTTSIITDAVQTDYFSHVYSKTHNRASCYLLGMMASHLCFKLKENKVMFTVGQIVLLSIVTYCCMELTQFYQWLFYVPGRPYYPLENAIYAPLHKVLWSAGICAIAVVFITTGYGVISPILNHSMYVPLSRLTYCVFLIHTNVQLISIASARVPEYLTYKTLGWMVGGDIMVSYVLASVLYVLVEAPVANLVDILLKKNKSIDR